MKIAFVKFLWIAALFPSFASAQTVVFRGGEHGEFTRVAASNIGDSGWKIEEAKGSFTIVFNKSNIDLDLSRVFSRINRNRVRSIEIESNGVRFDLACECSIAYNSYENGILAVDIFESAEIIDRNDADALSVSLRDNAINTIPDLWFTQRKNTEDKKSKPMLSDFVSRLPDSSLEQLNPIGSISDETIGLVSRLATLDILDTNDAIRPSNNSIVAEELRGAGSETGWSSSVDPGIRMRSSVQREFDSAIDLSKKTMESKLCSNPRSFEIGSWSSGDNISFALSAATLSVSEGPITEREDTVGAVKTYLYFGLGAEASSLLTDLGRDDPEYAPLIIYQRY